MNEPGDRLIVFFHIEITFSCLELGPHRPQINLLGILEKLGVLTDGFAWLVVILEGEGKTEAGVSSPLAFLETRKEILVGLGRFLLFTGQGLGFSQTHKDRLGQGLVKVANLGGGFKMIACNHCFLDPEP